jgi:hypothetical protein
VIRTGTFGNVGTKTISSAQLLIVLEDAIKAIDCINQAQKQRFEDGVRVTVWCEDGSDGEEEDDEHRQE